MVRYSDFKNVARGGVNITIQKMKFSIKDFFSKCDQIRRKLKKSLMENFIFCVVYESDSLTIEPGKKRS